VVEWVECISAFQSMRGHPLFRSHLLPKLLQLNFIRKKLINFY
jgi:hypothetical protein